MNIKSLALALILASTPLVTAESTAQTPSKKRTVLAALAVLAGGGLVIAAISHVINSNNRTVFPPRTKFSNFNGTFLPTTSNCSCDHCKGTRSKWPTGPQAYEGDEWVNNFAPYTPRGQQHD